MINESSIPPLLKELKELVLLLKQQQEQCGKEKGGARLGFGDSPRARRIYCNRSNACLWYWMKDGQIMPIHESTLTCLVERLDFEKVQRRGKEVWKVCLYVRADRPYILEAGYGSHFSRCLISALAAMEPDQLRKPISIEVQAGDSDEVLFCKIYSASGEHVFAPYDDQSDWKMLSRKAISAIDAANGRKGGDF